MAARGALHLDEVAGAKTPIFLPTERWISLWILPSLCPAIGASALPKAEFAYKIGISSNALKSRETVSTGQKIFNEMLKPLLKKE
jgi:hypothetical protein